MCIVRLLNDDEKLGANAMPYMLRDTKEKKLEILDKLRGYMKSIFATDHEISLDKFNFFCFGDFLSSDKDSDTIDFYIYADSWYASLISSYIKEYMLDIGLNVVTVEYDGSIGDVDVKAAESMLWIFNDDMSDGFKQLLKDLNTDHVNSLLNGLLSVD